ncbi:MAG: LytTR family DNA-binding domain-containing protein, partial [Cyclobacteriaceae bacterium]
MKVLILEDEQLAAEALSNMLQNLVEAEVVGMIPSIEAGRQWFQENELPELILSDIRLQDGISFQLFQELEIKVPIIFVTAYDHYAIKAFEVNSIDYLLKPIDSEQLKGAFDKIKERRLSGGNAGQFDNLISLMNEAKKTYRSRFLIKAGQKIKAVGIDKVAYFYSLNKLTYLVTYDGQ